jgi:hypothetical protein
MSDDREIKEIVSQLNCLQIQQTALLSHLERLSEGGEKATRPTSSPSVAAGTTREFAIGDRVRIRNPRRLQAVKGKIVRIGKSRITVEAKGGETIIRAPKNLEFDLD